MYSMETKTIRTYSLAKDLTNVDLIKLFHRHDENIGLR